MNDYEALAHGLGHIVNLLDGLPIVDAEDDELVAQATEILQRVQVRAARKGVEA